MSEFLLWTLHGRPGGVWFQKILKTPIDSGIAESPVQSAELEVAETVGRLMHFWGFKRPMGRMWTVLYLSEQPLSAAQLGKRLKMSAGGVSMALSELEKWGCVTRTWIPGDRRDYFVAEDDIWKMVQRVLRDRELSLVHDFGQTLTSAEQAVAQASASEATESLRFKQKRLHQLAELAETGETLLRALVAGNAVDPRVLIRTDS